MVKPFHKLLCAIFCAAFAMTVNAQSAETGGFAAFGDSPDLLPPEEAFRASLELSESNEALILSFAIEDGYYLYRDRLAVSSDDESLVLSPAQWPEAQIYEDAYFGKQAIYRKDFSAPLAINSVENESATLTVTFQGCADIGVCFPPTQKSFDISGFTAHTSTAQTQLIAQASSGQGSVLDQLKAYSSNSSEEGPNSSRVNTARLAFGGNNDTLLSPTEAYRPYIMTSDQGIEVAWEIEPDYYLYRDKLTYALSTDEGRAIPFMSSDLTVGEDYEDEFFGKTKVLRIEANDSLFLKQGANGTGELTVRYQGCADIGVCFPPETFSVPVTWNVTGGDSGDGSDVIAATSASGGASGDGTKGGANGLQLSEQDRLASQLGSGSLWFNAAAFFLFGLLLAFTPCVLPMVPILSSLILGGGEKQTTGQAFKLSVIYVLGMALTYTLVGVLVGLSGYNIQAWFQDPWILTGFAALFVILSLAMFGVYELQLPASLQTKLSNLSNRQSGGRSGGVFSMGILSALIVGPCVTAPLMGALIYIADTGNAVVGGTALFALSIGMGAPLILIGTSAGKWVPKAGGWMNAVKIIFGFLMLAMAIWMLSRFLEPIYVVLLGAALALCAGAWAVFEYSKSSNVMALRTLGTAAGIAVGVYGITLLMGALAGAPSLLRPLQGISVTNSAGPNSAAPSQHLVFEQIKSLDDLNATVQTAKSQGQSVMLDFYADWCVSCKEMEAFTFTDAAVQARLENVVLIQADVTKNDKIDQALLKHFGLFGPPAIIFYDPNGLEVRNARLVGFLNADAFGQHLDAVLAASASTQSAQAY